VKFTFKRYIPFLPLLVFLRQSIVLGGISPRKLPLFLIYVFRFIACEPLRIIEVLLFERRIQKQVLTEDPIFVLGHWRSGTSHLQQVLSEDPAHVSLNLYEMLSADHFLWTERWLLPFFNGLIKRFGVRYAFQRRRLDLRLCGELDTALCSLGSTSAYTWGHLFPKKYRAWMLSHVFENAHQADLSDYDYLIRKLSFQSGNKRVIVKSPGDTARISSLLKLYPNAKFVSISRPSYSIYGSTTYLWNAIQRENSLQLLNEEEISAQVIWTYRVLMAAYEKMKASIPVGNLCEISFGHLHSHPEETIRSVYKQLSLGAYPEAQLNPLFESNKEHRPENYVTDALLLQSLKDAWGKFFKD
jgi:hypothetical protein